MRRRTPNTTPRARDTSTKVLFPRFESETDEPEIYNRKLTRVTPRPWLPLVEVRALLDPQSVAASGRKLNVKGKWWGVYHHASTDITYGTLYESPFTQGLQLHRTRYVNHSYLWDRQAADGSGTEIVLERLSTNATQGFGFEEIMAMYVNGLASSHGRQQLVMADAEGNWVEPNYGQDNPERDYFLAMMRHLATRHALNEIENPNTTRPTGQLVS